MLTTSIATSRTKLEFYTWPKKQKKNNPEYQPNIEITKFLENHDDYLSIPEGWALDIHHTQKAQD